MPTKYIKPAGQGGDYTSLAAWEAGEQGNLTEPSIAIIDGDWSGVADTTAVTIDGWTTSESNYIHIYTSSSARHDGKWNTNKYRLQAGSTALTNNEDFVKIRGLQIKNTSTDFVDGPIKLNAPSAGAKITISHCILTTDGGIYPAGIHVVTATVAATVYCYNNIIYNFVGGSGWRYGIYISWNGSTFYIYNNTFYNCGTGIYNNVGSAYVKNNIFKSCSTATSGLNRNNCDYNSTDNPSLGYTSSAHDRVSQTFSFVNESGYDFHLTSTDTGAKDYGIDLSSDPNLAFSDDIDGQTRSGAWDIGADEYVAAGGLSIPIVMAYYKRRRA